MRRSWKRFRANSLRAAIEGCVNFARERHNRSVEQLAELTGINSKFTLYKYMESGKFPANLIRPFEHACGCCFVSDYLAASSGKLVIDIPSGRKIKDREVVVLQQTCTEAISHILKFAADQTDAETTLNCISQAMEQFAWHHQSVAKNTQPDLELFDG